MLSSLLVLSAVFSLIVNDGGIHETPRGEKAVTKCAINSFEREVEVSKSIFVGRVIGIKKDGNDRIFEFRVLKYWKGIEEIRVRVTVSENPRFQAQFEKGGEYLVFAKDDEEGGLYDGRCSRSKDISGFGGAVEEDLEKLGEARTCIGLEDDPRDDSGR